MEDQRPLDKIWKLIQGLDNWEGLLDPMNSHLRKEIIRYGEFAQACYDSFDFDPHSKYCGTCKYTAPISFPKTRHGPPRLPHQPLPLRHLKHQPPQLLPDVHRQQHLEPARQLDGLLLLGSMTSEHPSPAHFRDDPDTRLSLGFFDLYTKKEMACNFCTYSAREQVLSEVNRLIEKYRGEELSITVTGHSLGASLALLSAYDIAEMKVNILHDDDDSLTRIPITVFSFAGPRVGNLRFKERCEELGIRVLRVVNVHDKVPTVPGIIANENFQYQKQLEKALQFPWSYAHVGVELALDHTHSPFLKKSGDLGCAHNLEAHLHLVDGFHGKDQPFRSATGRDIALVNKDSNFLKRELDVPPYWRQDENKGMVRSSEGRWVVPDRSRIEAHPPDTGHHFEKVLRLARARLELFG
nr:phospholipase A1-Igamma3, chloroplastic-like [Ipomoea batatas]